MSNKNWFKRKRFGWGWVPVTWQGWLSTLIYILVLVGGSYWLLKDVPDNTYSDEVGYFLVLMSITTILFIKLASTKGPSGKWRLGKRDTDNPDQDW